MNTTDEEDDELTELVAIAQVVIGNNTAAVARMRGVPVEEVKIDGRTLPRGPRTEWRHAQALHCIRRDHLGLPGDPKTPLIGTEFHSHFRISRTRFRLIMEDAANSGDPFYKENKVPELEGKRSSLEARLLLPLKCLAFGVPCHTFQDYFQMSKAFARDCCFNFDSFIELKYADEYLRLPTAEDMRGINQLHKKKHGVDGMFGSLDCMHTYWKNCPKAWAGSYKGKKGGPSIVLEGLCDYNLWFWHASYGYPGTLNDLNILALSPLLVSLVDGSFAELEKLAKVVPFQLLLEEFEKMFILVDGIYPPYSRFVKGYPVTVSPDERSFTKWQESTRKDIERAFGVLQAKFKFLCHPIMLHKLDDIYKRVRCCLVLHNMCVSERVMGDCVTKYSPCQEPVGMDEDEAALPEDLQAVADAHAADQEEQATIGVANMPAAAARSSTARPFWNDLRNVEGHNRLIRALIELKKDS